MRLYTQNDQSIPKSSSLKEMTEEILPGVYFTPKESIGLQSKEINAMRELPSDALVFECATLKNSLIHLKSSNDEMEKHVAKDKELAMYIVENIQYMAKIRMKIDKMQEILKERE